MDVYLVDGTYELFRHYFGQPPKTATDGANIGAARGVLLSIMGMLARGATHVAVATDHVIESFRNDLWTDYKDGSAVPSDLRSQFDLLEDALRALGIVVWPMVEYEADDALASAAALAEHDARVEQIRICTPDKDLGQCVIGDRVVQLDRRRNDLVLNELAIREKFGIAPRSVPDWLALVGDSADGFPGLRGWGKRSASVVLAHYGMIEEIPDAVSAWDPLVVGTVRGASKLASTLAEERDRADLFKVLATLRSDLLMFDNVDELQWQGATSELTSIGQYFGDHELAERASRLVR